MITQTSASRDDVKKALRDVTTTACLFNFSRPVYITEKVWTDCIEAIDKEGRSKDELAVLQRLRHVLFMASNAVIDREKDLSCEFKIHRLPHQAESGDSGTTILKLVSNKDQNGNPIIMIQNLDEQ